MNPDPRGAGVSKQWEYDTELQDFENRNNKQYRNIVRDYMNREYRKVEKRTMKKLDDWGKK